MVYVEILPVILADLAPLLKPSPTPPSFDMVEVEASITQYGNHPERGVHWVLLLSPLPRRYPYPLPNSYCTPVGFAKFVLSYGDFLFYLILSQIVLRSFVLAKEIPSP